MLGPVVLDVHSTELSPHEIDTLKRPHVGGVIFFARNYSSPDQLSKLVKSIRSIRPDLLLTVDQEGGRVQRFKSGFTRLPPMQQFDAIANTDKAQAKTLAKTCGWVMAAELRSLDIDISFAPVLDLDDHTSKVIGDRSFSKRAMQATELAAAFIQGMHLAGMQATAKHFPGHGSVMEDSHVEAVSDTRPYEALLAHDLIPFIQLKDMYAGIMPAHVIYPCVDAKPVGYSAKWIKQVLKKDIGFDGVVFSDDLSMEAAGFAGDVCQRGAAALEAGCDAILICNQPEQAARMLDHLESIAWPVTGTLEKMKPKKPSPGASLAELQTSHDWQRNSALLNNLEI